MMRTLKKEGPMAKKSEALPKLRSSNEEQVAGMIARMFGVAPHATLDVVFDQINDTHGSTFPELRYPFGLYPWECPVPQYVMADKLTQLTQDLAASDGHAFVVKDSSATGKLSLWIVKAAFNDFPGNLSMDTPVRGLFNHFLVGDEWLKVTAYQLETCLRKLKSNPT